MTLQRVILIVLLNEAKRKPSRARFYGGEKKTLALSTFSTLNLPPKLDWEETTRRKHKKFNYNEAQYFFLIVVFTLCQLKKIFLRKKTLKSKQLPINLAPRWNEQAKMIHPQGFSPFIRVADFFYYIAFGRYEVKPWKHAKCEQAFFFSLLACWQSCCWNATQIQAILLKNRVRSSVKILFTAR